MRFTSEGRPILIVVGPSGAGKSTVIRRLADDGLVAVNPTWTTRPPRPGELEEGIEHRFVSESDFAKLEADGFFIETARMFGLPFSYGLAPVKPSEPGLVSLVMLRASLMPLLSKHYKNTVVYQIEDELETIERRLQERQAAGEPIGSRISDYHKEIALGKKYAKRTFVNSNDIENLAQKIKQALREDFPA